MKFFKRIVCYFKGHPYFLCYGTCSYCGWVDKVEYERVRKLEADGEMDGWG